MKPLLDPGDQTIDNTNVGFSHRNRVQLPALVAALAVAALLVQLHGNGGSESDALGGPAWPWIIVVAAAVALTGLQVFGPLRAAWARWAALAGALVAGTFFGSRADLPKGSPSSIVQIELAGNWGRVDRCDCVAPLRDSIHYDFGFIAAYVALLVLLVAWAGCYYRLGVVRDARTLMVSASIAAGFLDVVEDKAMLRGIGHHDTDFWWQTASVCAWAKWVLVLVVVGYVAGGVFAWWVTPTWIRIASWRLYADVRDSEDSAKRATPPKAMTREGSTEQLDVSQPLKLGAVDRRRNFGIALSGGGIRASSISLGSLQVLDDTTDLGWDRAHAVTAVSGGSNMASGWSIARSGYATTDEGNPQRVPPAGETPRAWVDDNGSATPEERHLVANLGYLLLSEPRGSSADREALGDALTTPAQPSYRPAAIATVLSGLFVNTVVLLAALWAVTRPAGWLLNYLVDKGDDAVTGADIRSLVSSGSFALPGVVFLVVGFVVLLIWILLAQFILKAAEDSKQVQRLMTWLKSTSYGALGLGAGLLVLLWGYVELVGAVPRVGSGHTLIAALGGAAGVVGSTAQILRKPLARFAPKLGGIAFVVVSILLGAVATWKAAEHGPVWDGFGWNSGYNWVAAIGLLCAVQLLVSPERWALAPFYRGKLRSAYATYRTVPGTTATPYLNDNATNSQAEREPSFSAFAQPNGSGMEVTTPFVVCATATVSTPAVRTHFGTPALSVTFDPAHMTLHFPNDEPGRWSQYKVSTERIDRLGRPFGKRMTTMMAVAIASAAVSPAMGRYRIGPTSMLLTFFNIRLGVWIANPRYVAQLEAAGIPMQTDVGYARTGLSYLFREFFGWHNLDDPYLYLTDGGHWENTGLVEMLRNPEIREVVCIDADSGPGDAVSSLTKAIKIAQPECGVNIDISLDPMRTTPSTSFAPAYAPRAVNVGFLTYKPGRFEAGDPVGVLWYSRPALTTDMPQRLLAFHEGQQDYPRASTLNQFFDVATFQAYRDLGRDSAREIIEARALLIQFLSDLPENQSQILSRLDLLKDQHWVFEELARGARATGQLFLVKEFCQSVHATLT